LRNSATSNNLKKKSVVFQSIDGTEYDYYEDYKNFKDCEFLEEDS
jgi:hypothetical protein